MVSFTVWTAVLDFEICRSMSCCGGGSGSVSVSQEQSQIVLVLVTSTT